MRLFWVALLITLPLLAGEREDWSILQDSGLLDSAHLFSGRPTPEERVRRLNEAAVRLDDATLLQQQAYERLSSDLSFVVFHLTEKDPNLLHNEGRTWPSGLSISTEPSMGGVFSWKPRLLLGSKTVKLSIHEGTWQLGHGIRLEIGRWSAQWGPGLDGLLLTDHARPLDGLWIQDESPKESVWLPALLGTYHREFFLTRLGKGRTVPRPWLMGMAFSAKPSPRWEWGIHRTALFGGAGQSIDFLQVLIGSGENDPSSSSPGDQKAGGFIRHRFSWGKTSGATYLEAAGEDSAGGLPSKWAFLGGLHIPSIGGSNFGLRLEATNTRISLSGTPWYTHNTYQSGYNYHLEPLGARTGSDGRSLGIQLSAATVRGAWVGNLYRWHSYLSTTTPESGWLGSLGWASESYKATVSCSQVDNLGSISTPQETTCLASLSWHY